MALTAQQVETRKTGIGGSDCAIVLGLSKWKTARQLYHEKRGELPAAVSDETEEQWWGRMLEPVVRQKYAEKTGRTVMVPADTIRSVAHPFMLAHIDGYTDDNRGYEGKTAMASTGWGEEGTDAIPTEYLFQTHHYMVVTQLPVFDVATLIGRRFAFYEVQADAELHEMIVAAESEFMRRVREGDPPPLDYLHKTAIDCVKLMYPGTNGTRIAADAEAIRCRDGMTAAAAIINEQTKIRDGWKAQLLDIMGEAALLAFPDGKCYRRAKVDKDAYTCEATSYVDARFINDPDLKKGSKRK